VPPLIVDLLVRPLAEAFLQVGVWVALLLGLFGWLQWRTGGRLLAMLERHRRWGPAVGALLGMTPGCGGAILLMPLYARGAVSFGSVVAVLVATMGDSSFVLIAADPLMALWVHLLLLAAGTASGYLVDLLRIAPRPAPGGAALQPARPLFAVGPASTVGAAVAEPSLLRRPVLRFPPPWLATFWALVATGLVVGTPIAFGLRSEQQLTTWAGGFNLFLVVGVLGTGWCAAVLLAERRPQGSWSPLRTLLRDGARETAAVTMWVAAAFLLTAGAITLAGLDPANLPWGTPGTWGALIGVGLGAAIGLIPGCGPQIVLTGLWAQGAIPLSTLVANALSQDGDALFPLLQRDRRSALVATALSAVPAVLIGGSLALLGR
jgi:hypothetical protein